MAELTTYTPELQTHEIMAMNSSDIGMREERRPFGYSNYSYKGLAQGS